MNYQQMSDIQRARDRSQANQAKISDLETQLLRFAESQRAEIEILGKRLDALCELTQVLLNRRGGRPSKVEKDHLDNIHRLAEGRHA